MKAFGLARLGRDSELRTTAQGEAVAGLALAFTYGRKDADGKRPTQWVEAALWGKRATALAPYLVKGTLVSITLDEVHIETYQGQNGPGHKLAAKVIDIELCGSPATQAPKPAPAPAPKPAPRPAPANSGFDDMDDDIPF